VLFANRAAALKNAETNVIRAVMRFNESVRGLALNAPIDFRGITLGNITAISAEYNEAHQRFDMKVETEIYPKRLGSIGSGDNSARTRDEGQEVIESMIARGLRAQLRTANLLTGQLYVALDVFPQAPRIKPRPDEPVLEIPTMATSLGELQSTIASIATKLDAFPLEQIGKDLGQTLRNANQMTDAATHLMQRLDAEIAPEAHAALVEARKAIASAERAVKPDSPLSQDAREAMLEIRRAAAAVRELADYLDRHPEALLRGKKDAGGKQKENK
jgi:paraquat-inducible protein B